MNIEVNGAPATLSAAGSLEAALQELGYGEATVATALNGEVVPRGERAATVLAEGDCLEVLAPMQGG